MKWLTVSFIWIAISAGLAGFYKFYVVAGPGDETSSGKPVIALAKSGGKTGPADTPSPVPAKTPTGSGDTATPAQVTQPATKPVSQVPGVSGQPTGIATPPIPTPATKPVEVPPPPAAEKWLSVRPFVVEMTRDGRPSTMSSSVLDDLVNHLNSNPAQRVKLIGYFRSDEYRPFAEQNARSIKSELLKRGISDARIVFAGEPDPNRDHGQFEVTCDVQKKE